MWNSVSLSSLLPSIDLFHFLPTIDISHVVPAVPSRISSSVGSTLVAMGIGYAYGLVGRVIYPNSGIKPFHYSIWFTLAYQIKQFVLLLEENFHDFLGVRIYLEELEQVSENELDLSDYVRFHCWKMIQLKHKTVEAVDGVFANLFNIRPYDEIHQDNVEDASFLEMCRYRIWPVFKSAVLETVCISIAYRLCNSMGFSLPVKTSVPLLVVIFSIVRDIILVPALHCYARWCNHIADKIEDSNEEISAHRAKWFRFCLPSLTIS